MPVVASPAQSADLAVIGDRINALHEQVRGAASGMAQRAVECGRLLIEAKAALPHGGWLPWLEAYCPTIGVRQAQTYMRVARLADDPNAQRASHLSIREAVKAIADSKPHVAHNSGDNEWYTPPEYVEAARVVMGAIDLDPASSEIANRTVEAAVFYTADDDGLSREWIGRVWMNPPYASELIGKFTSKLCGHLIAGEIEQAIVLVNNATETQWFQEMGSSAASVCFPAGRIKFLDEEGDPSGAPLQGQAILYFGGEAEQFANEFSRFGLVVRLTEQGRAG